MLTYEVIRTLYEFERYQESWTTILENTNNNNPFIEYGWVYTWWEILGRSQQVEIYVVTNEKQPIAFFPFVHKKRFGVHLFQFVGVEEAHYMQIVSEKEWLEKATRFLFEQLENRFGQIVFQLEGLLESENTSKVIEKYAIEKQYPYSIFRTVVPYIDLKENDYSILMKDFKKKYKSIQRREKRLRTLGNLSFHHVKNEPLDEMFHLYEKRWSKKMGGNNFSAYPKRMFYEVLFQRTYPTVHVEVNKLMFENKWVSFTYDLCCRGRKIGILIGHDSEFNLFGLGRMVDKENLASAHQMNYQLYDFGSGYEPYKFEWATDIDFVRKIVFASKGKRAKCLRTLKGIQYSIKFLMRRSRKLVEFKRNTIGELLYLFTTLRLSEWHEFIASKLSRYISYKIVDVYRYEMDRQNDKNNFKRLPLQEALSLNQKSIVDDYYRGFHLYQSIDKKVLFKQNRQFIRDESVHLMEKIQPNATFMKDYLKDDLLYIVFNIGEETKYIWTTISWGQFKKRKALEKLGFKQVERRRKVKLFRLEKIRKKTLSVK